MSDLSKKNILARLQNALQNKTAKPFPTIQTSKDIFENQTIEHLDICFAEQFAAVGGQFFYCENSQELAAQLMQLFNLKQWKKIACWEPFLQDFLHQLAFNFNNDAATLLTTDVALTSCRALVARTGSIIIDSWQSKGRGISIVPPAHIVVARVGQIVANLSDILPQAALQNNQLPSVWSIITGASRTADIEKTLVMGAHGPKEIYVFLLE
jgi:L-lactate dehydrogenase complex protein LldG